MAERRVNWLVSNIQDVISISGAGQVLGTVVSAWPSAARRGMQYL